MSRKLREKKAWDKTLLNFTKRDFGGVYGVVP
jgi:hypothetical protein